MQLISQTLINFHKTAIKIKSIVILSAFAALNFVVYFSNKKKDIKFDNSFKIWQKNFNSECSFDIKVEKINESSLLSSNALLFMILGFFFAF